MRYFSTKAKVIADILVGTPMDTFIKKIPQNIFEAAQSPDLRIYPSDLDMAKRVEQCVQDILTKEEYKVTIKIDSKAIYADCTCPDAIKSPAKPCKHTVFALLSYHPEYENKNPAPTAQDFNLRIQKIADYLNQQAAALLTNTDNAATLHYYLLQNWRIFKNFIALGVYEIFLDILFDIRKLINNENVYQALLSCSKQDAYSPEDIVDTWIGINMLTDLAHDVAPKMPLPQRIEWLEKWLDYPSPSSRIVENLDTNLVFSDADFPEVCAYTNANLADKKKKLPKIFYEAHKQLFG